MTQWQFQSAPYDTIHDARLFGFVYRITNLTNDMTYIGQRQFYNRKGKTYSEGDWRGYTGSNKTLNADIAKGDVIRKEIVRFCVMKAEMNYFETKLIMDEDALLRPNEYYNQWIKAQLTGKGNHKWLRN